jgi:hypothetical protein
MTSSLSSSHVYLAVKNFEGKDVGVLWHCSRLRSLLREHPFYLSGHLPQQPAASDISEPRINSRISYIATADVVRRVRLTEGAGTEGLRPGFVIS